MKGITVFLSGLLLCLTSLSANAQHVYATVEYEGYEGGVTVSLSDATICFKGECHPALVGKKTLAGEYKIEQLFTDTPGYGGDVLRFRELSESIQAIHRPWLGKPSQRRLERLKSKNPEDRKGITNGCINVDYDVYDELVDCCSGQTLTVTQ